MAWEPGFHSICEQCSSHLYCLSQSPLQVCVVCRCIGGKGFGHCTAVEKLLPNLLRTAEDKFQDDVQRHSRAGHSVYNMHSSVWSHPAGSLFVPIMTLDSVTFGVCRSCSRIWNNLRPEYGPADY